MPRFKEEFKTFGDVFDEFTNRTIFNLCAQGVIDGMESPISVGKESNVFTAQKGKTRLIVKIYRLQVCDFNKMCGYLQTDPRFDNVGKNRRKIIFNWAKREHHNLLKAREAGVSCPTPYAFKNNVLIEEMIGDEDPSPKMSVQKPKDIHEFFNLTIQNLIKLRKANIVHGDLSQFNILNYNEKPIFIDFSHGTINRDPNYEEYWERDIKNVVNYFHRLGVKTPLEEIKKRILEI